MTESKASPAASPAGGTEGSGADVMGNNSSGDPSALPAKSFKITFMPMGKTIEVGQPDPAGHHEGQPGSILDWADQHDIELEHACGGFIACSTCHVIVREGLDSCNESTEDEEDMLDEAPGLTLHSRLGCQCVPDGSQDIVVEIPSWNRNLVKEGKH